MESRKRKMEEESYFLEIHGDVASTGSSTLIEEDDEEEGLLMIRAMRRRVSEASSKSFRPKNGCYFINSEEDEEHQRFKFARHLAKTDCEQESGIYPHILAALRDVYLPILHDNADEGALDERAEELLQTLRSIPVEKNDDLLSSSTASSSAASSPLSLSTSAAGSFSKRSSAHGRCSSDTSSTSMSDASTDGVRSRNNPRCSHGRIKYVCKQCGGASICSHGRVRSGRDGFIFSSLIILSNPFLIHSVQGVQGRLHLCTFKDPGRLSGVRLRASLLAAQQTGG